MSRRMKIGETGDGRKLSVAKVVVEVNERYREAGSWIVVKGWGDQREGHRRR